MISNSSNMIHALSDESYQCGGGGSLGKRGLVDGCIVSHDDGGWKKQVKVSYSNEGVCECVRVCV